MEGFIANLSFIVIVIILICLAVVSEKKEKRKELEKEKVRIEREKNMEKKRLEESKKESLQWNNSIQTNTGNIDSLYRPTKKIKALVGNYSNSIAVYTNMILKNMGIETEFVPCGHNIIDKINNNEKYDIIITNNMYNRGESGEQVLNELKGKDGFDTPIVVLTVDQDARNEYVNCIGFDEYIEKPISIQKAIPILKNLLKIFLLKK